MTSEWDIVPDRLWVGLLRAMRIPWPGTIREGREQTGQKHEEGRIRTNIALRVIRRVFIETYCCGELDRRS